MPSGFSARVVSGTDRSGFSGNVYRLIGLIGLCCVGLSGAGADESEKSLEYTLYTEIVCTRDAVKDLRNTFGERYPEGDTFLNRLNDLEREVHDASPEAMEAVAARFRLLQREALIANPLVSGQPILYVVRAQYLPDHHNTETMFQNGEINTAGYRGGGALKTVDFGKNGKLETLIDLPEGIVRDPEISFDGRQTLVSMRKNIRDDYHIYEIDLESRDVKQLTYGGELSDIDPMYLPNGRIVFVSTREPKLCQCNRHIMGNLFLMDSDGGNIHQLGRNTLFEGHPSLIPDGRILYDRWEYVDKHFGPALGLWTVNPDGTNHAVFYGNNAWSPGAILDARMIPDTERFIATFGSCHDRPWGALAIVDRRLGMDGIEPVVMSLPKDIKPYLTNIQDYGRGELGSGHPCAGQIDNFTRLPVKYEDPYPLSDTYFLASRTIEGERMGIVLFDTFGNEIVLHEDGPGCYDPMPVAPRMVPSVVPPKKNLAEEQGLFYVLDVYTGTGMENVERGSVKWLRVVEAPPKPFWTPGYWGIDATQAPAMNWNCTSNKRILGTVPVEPDGSAYFYVPSDTFLYFQLLDENGMMIQTMRSGTMVQPGERLGCVGCHDHRLTAGRNEHQAVALIREPSRLKPWYGPPRDFNYLTEVQPVFDKHCVSCHDYGKPAGEKLNLAGDIGLAFNTSYLELRRKSAARWYKDEPGTPKILVKAVDDGPAEILPAYAWGSHRSKLVDAIRNGHQGIELDPESIDRIVTWIDLNAPYYGSYASAYPDNAFGRSPLTNDQLAEIRKLTGIPVGETPAEFQGSQINFTRPEWSVCLQDLNPGESAYNRIVEIIESGSRQLLAMPREDMPGAQLVGIDRVRQKKFELQFQFEKAVRRTLIQQHRTD